MGCSWTRPAAAAAPLSVVGDGVVAVAGKVEGWAPVVTAQAVVEMALVEVAVEAA